MVGACEGERDGEMVGEQEDEERDFSHFHSSLYRESGKQTKQHNQQYIVINKQKL